MTKAIPPDIGTAYDLPYTVNCSPLPLLAADQTVVLTLYWRQMIAADSLEDVHSLYTAWLMLASTGALSGNNPITSDVRDLEIKQSGPHGITVMLISTQVDETVLGMLAQSPLLLRRHDGLERLDITLAGYQGPLSLLPRLDRNCYPDHHRPLPFSLAWDDGATEPYINIQFSRELTRDEQAEIEAHLGTWAANVQIGFYGIAPIPPTECGIIFDDIEFLGAELEWGLDSLQAHPDCLHGMLNALVKWHHFHGLIRAVIIE